MKIGNIAKKSLSVLLALMVVLAQVPVSFAADTDVSVTWNLTNITASGVTSVEAGQALSATLAAESGYILPQSVSVSGTTASAYALDNGQLSIPADEITGDLTITANALQESYSVSWTLEHITASPAADTVQTAQGLSVTLSADDGYALPAAISVSGAEYSYSNTEGTLTIPAYKITSNIAIEAVATEKPCTITWNLSDIAADPKPETVAKDATVTTTLSVETGFSLPESVTVGGSATLNTYDNETGSLSFTATDFGKEISISASAIPNKYNVSAAAGSESYIEITSENPAAYKSTVTFTVNRTQYVDNYEVDVVSAETSGGATVAVQNSGNGYSFVMPADSVNINVTWKLVEADYEIQSNGSIVPATNGWYAVKEADVVPLEPASKVSTSETGPFDNKLHVAEGTTTFYLSDGISGSVVEKSVKLDGTEPEGKAKKDGQNMTHNYENGLNPNSVVTIESEDAGSGIDTVKYAFLAEEDYNKIVTDGNLNRNLSETEISAINAKIGTSWKNYSSKVDFSSLSTWTRYVLVIQITDKAGNKGYYYYGVAYSKEAPKLSIAVYDEGKGIYEKKGEAYHIKDTEADDDSVLLRIDYNGSQSKYYPPKDTNIIVKNGDKTLTAGVDYEFSAWEWSESASKFICYVRIYIDPRGTGTPLEEGTYQVAANVKDYFAFFTSATAESPEIKFSRHTPALEFSYEGFTGYDEGATYKTSGAPKDEVAAAETGSEFVSDKTFYINDGKSTTITFSDTNDEIIKSWTVTASINGTAPADAKTLTGITVDDENKKVIIDGSSAKEGKYVLPFEVSGFNDCTKTVTVTVVVDRTGPSADAIAACGFVLDDENNRVQGKTVEDSVWTNENDVLLTLANINDVGGLLEECVNASEGITGEKTITDGVWIGTISGEQNHKYSVTLTDKAGNSTTKEFTAKIDTTAAKDITVKARKDTTDMALITDQFTFGVFHVDYNKLSVSVEDPQPDNPGVYDGNEKISEISSVEYFFLTNKDDPYKELFSYYDSEGVKQYYSQADVKANNDAQDAVVDNIQSYMDGIKAQPRNGGVWKECIRDAKDNPNKVATGLVTSNLQYVVFFRVWDNAGNMSCFYRNVIITDDEAPLVSFAVDESVSRVEQDDGTVIYTGVVPVKVTVTEPHSDTDAYSGINKVSYTVYYGDNEVFTSGSFENLADLDIEKKGSSTASEDDPLAEQGTNQAVKTITLDDLDGKVIDAKNIYIKVEVQDISGNRTSFTSDSQIGFINIDKANPEVKVEFTGNQLNGKYYGADRTATITVVDNNFDPATGITFDTTGSLGDWTASDPDAYGKVTYTAPIVFADGDHHFIITETKDKANHKITDSDVDYNVTDQKDFVVDTVDPVAAITFARVDGKGFSDYNNADVTMTITVSEKNFSTNGVNLTVTRDGGAFGVNLGWNNNGDNHTASYTFDPEGAYVIDLTVTDLAGHSDQVDTEQFVLDKTAPEIEILNVEDQHAYNAESVIPVIRVTDTNYSDIGVEITLTGVNGGTAFYDEANIAGGQEFAFENIEDDDLYTLTVKAVDEAENESEMTIQFSVNRNGSVFTGDAAIAKAMENGIPYFRTETLPPIRVIETNVDIIENAKLYLTKDNNNIDLAEGRDYTITRKDVNGGWSQYIYALNDDLFLDDGVYRVSLVTRDAAGNAKNAESVVAFIVDNTLPVLFVTDLESGAIYNEEVKHVVFTPNDNLVLSKIQVILNGEEIAVWEGEELAEMIRNGAEFAFDIPESNSLQNAQIILTDAAGNENENQLIENFLVSTNVFVRFYNNKPVFYSTIAGVVVLSGSLWAILARRKKAAHTAG